MMSKRARSRSLAVLAVILIPVALFAVAQAEDSSLSPEGQAQLEEKQRLHELEESTFLAPEETVPPSPAAGPPSPEPPPKWEEGLFGEEEADFPAGLGWDFSSVWKQDLGGQYVAVYAGAVVAYDTMEPTGEGIVVVMYIDPQTWGHTFESFTPPIEGPLKIESADGHQLTVVSDSGEKAIFDVDAMAFDEAAPASN